MASPFFYIGKYDAVQKEIVLDEDTSKHVVQVLRMKVGEQLNLTDGVGNLITCSIADDNKKHCTVEIKDKKYSERSKRRISIAISLLKNSNRFEWFLEKATEVGVAEIIPLICIRTEKEKFRYERMQGICISAMLQSQQTWLPVLHEPKEFESLPGWKCLSGQNFIAHCLPGKKQPLPISTIQNPEPSLICIGPEGDFTEKEIELALQHNFIPVSLGDTRLRTETAGVMASILLKQEL